MNLNDYLKALQQPEHKRILGKMMEKMIINDMRFKIQRAERTKNDSSINNPYLQLFYQISKKQLKEADNG